MFHSKTFLLKSNSDSDIFAHYYDRIKKMLVFNNETFMFAGNIWYLKQINDFRYNIDSDITSFIIPKSLYMLLAPMFLMYREYSYNYNCSIMEIW